MSEKQEEQERCVQWRYAILNMHGVIALAIPRLNDRDLKRFHKHFKTRCLWMITRRFHPDPSNGSLHLPCIEQASCQ